MEREQARLFDLDPRLRDVRADRALLRERSAEGDAVLHAAAHHFQRALGDADDAHTVMNAPGTKAALRDLEAPPLTEQHIGSRDPDIVELDLRVSMRRIVKPEHRERPLDSDARRI